MKSARSAVSAAFLLGLTGTVCRADVHPNTKGGVAVPRAFEVGEIDNINTFNGNLVLTIQTGIALSGEQRAVLRPDAGQQHEPLGVCCPFAVSF